MKDFERWCDEALFGLAKKATESHFPVPYKGAWETIRSGVEAKEQAPALPIYPFIRVAAKELVSGSISLMDAYSSILHRLGAECETQTWHRLMAHYHLMDAEWQGVSGDPQLTPSHHGEKCIGNGEYPGIECCWAE